MAWIIKAMAGAAAVAALKTSPDPETFFFLGWLVQEDVALAIGIGISISIVMQIGIMIKLEKTRGEIQRSAIVNALAAAGNFFLTAWIVRTGDLTPISGLVIAVVIGITGVDIYIELGKRAVKAIPEFLKTMLTGLRPHDPE